MKDFTYDEALAYIHGLYGVGEKHELRNMSMLLEKLSNPQEKFATVHIAGTNGKGSVCALLHGALCYAGYRTGLYTSPYLQRFNERMRINGEPIPDGKLAELMGEIAEVVEALCSQGIYPTEFEVGTALAFLYFAREAVDIAVIEVGLGGRLDPTNVIVPRVCAIASIGLDHTKALGDTLGAIAGEKAGIAKPGVPLVLSAQVTGEARAVIEDRCKVTGAPLLSAPEDAGIPYGLMGVHQARNAAVAAEVLRTLDRQGWSVPDSAIAEGFRRTRWPGRLEWVMGTPPVLLDGAHNPQGARALAAYLAGQPSAKTVLVYGVMADKDWQGIAGVFAGFADSVITVTPDIRRGLDPEILADAFKLRGMPAQAAKTTQEALVLAAGCAGNHGRIVVAGSLYLVGAARTELLGLESKLLSPV